MNNLLRISLILIFFSSQLNSATAWTGPATDVLPSTRGPAFASSLVLSGPASVLPGEQFDLEIHGVFPDGLIAGGIDLIWDDALVQLDHIELELGVEPFFSCPGSTICPPNTANSATIVWGQFLIDLIPTGAGQTLMATITFTALNAVSGPAVFSMVDNPALTGGWFGAGFEPIDPPSFQSTSIEINEDCGFCDGSTPGTSYSYEGMIVNCNPTYCNLVPMSIGDPVVGCITLDVGANDSFTIDNTFMDFSFLVGGVIPVEFPDPNGVYLTGSGTTDASGDFVSGTLNGQFVGGLFGGLAGGLVIDLATGNMTITVGSGIVFVSTVEGAFTKCGSSACPDVGTQCDDGIPCTENDVYDADCNCVGTPLNCDDGIACTEDFCNELTGICENIPNDALCDNGIFCDGVETCDAILGCIAGTPPTDDGDPCTIDSCDEQADIVDHQQSNDPAQMLIVSNPNVSEILENGDLIDFGSLNSLTSICVGYFIENTGCSDLEISTPFSPQGEFYTLSQPSSVIPAGESTVFNVCIDGSCDLGILNETLEFTTNDPDNPTFLINLTANIIDNVPPWLSCPDITVNNDAGQCGANVSFSPSIAQDCSTVSFSYSPEGPYPIGTTPVTCTAVDAGGFASTCSFDVTVNDTTPPTITCPENISVDVDPGKCDAYVEVLLPVFNDNCCEGSVPEEVILGDPILDRSSTPVQRISEEERSRLRAEAERLYPGGAMDGVAPPNHPISIDQAHLEIENSMRFMSEHTAIGITFNDSNQEYVYSELDPNSSLNNEITTAVVRSWAGDYHDGLFYVSDLTTGEIYSYDELGAETYIGGTSSGLHTGLAYNATNDRWYELTIQPRQFNEVDINTGARTFISNLDGSLDPFWLAIDNDGSAYLLDAGKLYSLDLSSGAFSLIGSSGILHNNAIIDADFDPNTGTLYATTRISNGSIANYAEVNTSTGEYTLLGPITGPNGETPWYVSAFAMLGDPTPSCTVTNSHTEGTDASGFYPIGETEVTYTVTDAAGLTATCSFRVVVDPDQIPAVISCPEDITVESGNSTEPTESETGPGTGEATASDNSDPDPDITYEDVKVLGDCLQDTVITRVWKAEDACGNTTYCLQTINVVDDTPPVIDCPNDTIVSCDVSLDPMDLGLEAAATDAADPDVVITYLNVSDQTDNGSCGDHNYSLVRVWYAEDACGNSTFCKQTIMVVDTVPPSITCPETLYVEPSEGLPEPDFAGGSTSDNCGGAVTVTFVSDVSDGLSEPETVTRTYMAIDACGNTAECSHLIIIDDVTPPMITCPEPVSVICIEDVPAPDISSVITTSDCGVTVTHVGDESDGGSCPETITRTYLATDECGNSITCEQTITVYDMTPPTMTCPGPVTVDCSEAIPAPDFEGGSTDDNCAAEVAVSHVSDVSDGNLNPEVITRTYRATDACGNTVECTQTITILDTEAPTFDCPADEVVSNDPGECGAFVEIAIPEVLDNCCSLEVAPESIAPPHDDADLKAAQAANEARVAAMRAASVSSGTAERMIFTDEMIDKIGTSKTSINTASMKLGGGCPNPISDPSFEAGAFGGIWTEFSTNFITVLCDPIGCGPALALTGDWYAWFGGAGAIFEEGSVSQVVTIPSDALTLDVPMATGFIGSTTDFFEVLIDGTAVLTVLGSEGVGAYVLYSIDITAYAGGTHTIDFHSITNEGESFIMDDVDIICPGSQACTLILTNDHTGTDDASGFYPVGETTVTYTAQESNGNSTVCSFTVTVNDTEGLVIVCPEPISVVAAPGACTAVVTYETPVGTENCEGTSTQQIEGRTSGDEFEVGVTLNTFLVIDANGNTALCDFTVTVLEDEAPYFEEYTDYYEVPFDADLCGAEVALETPPAFDNCGPVTVVNDYNGTSNGLDVYPAGEETLVTWTATDASGNTSTTTTTVKVGKLKAASNLRVVCREGQGTFKLKWDLAPGAQRYRAQVRNLLGTIVLDKQMWNPGANAFGPLPNDTVPAGNYQWRVISYCKMDDAPNLPGWQEYAKRFTSWQPITLPCTNQAALPFDDSSQSIKLLSTDVNAYVYPNPTEGIFYLDTDMEDYTLEVYDLKGQMVYNETRMKTGITELDLQEAPNGMYLLKMYNNSAIMTKRITIQR